MSNFHVGQEVVCIGKYHWYNATPLWWERIVGRRRNPGPKKNEICVIRKMDDRYLGFHTYRGRTYNKRAFRPLVSQTMEHLRSIAAKPEKAFALRVGKRRDLVGAAKGTKGDG